jgi:hypothetical protein
MSICHAISGRAISALVILFVLVSVPAAHAEDKWDYIGKLWNAAGDDSSKVEQALEMDCKRIESFADKGAKLYRQKQYTAARHEFLTQVFLLEYCDTPGDRDRSVVAYNNVALTYAREGKVLRARAWMSINADDPISRFNLKKIRSRLDAVPERIEGKYVQYAGQGRWANIRVNKKRDKYEISAEFLRVGPSAIFGGLNVGNIEELDMPLNLRHTLYRGSEEGSKAETPEEISCEIAFDFGKNTAHVKTLKGDGFFVCGFFGAGVSADGKFYRVED